jgi:periplasmic divalent cation tolerance protein
LQHPSILVLTQLPDIESARKLAQALLTRRLAACVNIGATIESMYHWQGAIEMAAETPVAIKTRADLYPAVESLVRTHHPYELPEIIAVPITGGLPQYLDWIAAETQLGRE